MQHNEKRAESQMHKLKPKREKRNENKKNKNSFHEFEMMTIWYCEVKWAL